MREDMLQALSPDLEKINAWIDNNFCNVDNERTDSIIVLEEWANCKANLFDAFGGKLQISKEVQFHKPPEDLRDDISEILRDGRSGGEFFRELDKKMLSFFGFKETRIVDVNFYSLYKENYDTSIIGFLDLIYLIYTGWSLATNCLPTQPFNNTLKAVFKVKMPSDKILSVDSNMKPMRLLNKLAKEFELEESFEKFRLEHSRILNDSRITGKLIISIHPLDYMTMSDNDSDWSSCMSWREHGDYCLGTVEMMNSPYVICAFLESSHPMEMYSARCLWNNKKWRCLFICHDDAIVKIKGYPYQHKELETAIIRMIADLFPGKYEDTIYELEKPNYGMYGCTHVNEDKTTTWVPASFSTDYMYNDFGRNSNSLILFNKNCPKRIDIDYSGKPQCMHCGEFFNNFASHMVLCAQCSGMIRCECCGEFFDADEIYTSPRGDCYCESCYCDTFHEDPIYGEDVRYDECQCLYLVPKTIIENLKMHDLLSEDGLKSDNLTYDKITENLDVPYLETIYELSKNDEWYIDRLKKAMGSLPIECRTKDGHIFYYYVIDDWFDSKWSPYVNNGSHLLNRYFFDAQANFDEYIRRTCEKFTSIANHSEGFFL